MSGGRALVLHRMREGEGGIAFQKRKKESQLFRLVRANGKKVWSTAMGVQLKHTGVYSTHTAPYYTSTHSVQRAAVLCQMS